MARTKLKVLLVEDNQDHAELIRIALSDLVPEDKFFIVTHGEDALNYLYRQGVYSDKTTSPRPSLILLDIKLPRLDGFDVLRFIKNDEKLKSIPVVLLTTSSDKNEISRGYKCGANSYVTKPVKFDDFIDCVRNIHYYWSQTNTPPLLDNNGYAS